MELSRIERRRGRKFAQVGKMFTSLYSALKEEMNVITTENLEEEKDYLLSFKQEIRKNMLHIEEQEAVQEVYEEYSVELESQNEALLQKMENTEYAHEKIFSEIAQNRSMIDLVNNEIYKLSSAINDSKDTLYLDKKAFIKDANKYNSKVSKEDSFNYEGSSEEDYFSSLSNNRVGIQVFLNKLFNSMKTMNDDMTDVNFLNYGSFAIYKDNSSIEMTVKDGLSFNIDLSWEAFHVGKIQDKENIDLLLEGRINDNSLVVLTDVNQDLESSIENKAEEAQKMLAYQIKENYKMKVKKDLFISLSRRAVSGKEF